MRGITRTLGALFAASALASPAWAELMYFNRLASDAAVPAGTYGSITTTADIRATTFTAASALSNTASAPEIGGSYTNIIKSGTNTDTHTVAGWFYLAALPSSESTYNNIYLARSQADGGSDSGYKVAVNSAGAIAVGKLGSSDGFNGSPVLTAASVVSAKTWFYLTVAVTKSSSGSTAIVQVYINGSAVETGSGTFATNLNGNNCARVDIGTGVSMAAGFYVDTTPLSVVSTIQALATNETYNAFSGGDKSASLSGANNVWSTVTWTPTGVPTATNDVTLTVTDAATLTVDTDANIYSLKVDGAGSLTFAGSNSLTVTSSTTVSADTNVSGITASLGAVTLGEGKTLTMDASNTFASLAGTYSDATPSQVVYDATTASVSADATLRAAIRDFTGLVTIKGSGANGMELPYINAVANPLSSRIVFDGGTHTFKYGRADTQRFATDGHGDDYPTIDVKTGTTLNFYLKDLSGWNGSVGTTPAVIRVRDGGTLNFKNYDGSGFFRDRLILEKNATVTAENRFTLHGGAQSAENLAQIAMLDSTTEAVSATLGGQVNLTNVGGNGEAGTKGASISVGTNATLKATAAFAGTSAGSLTKEGAGVLELSSTASTVAAPLTINAGKVVIKDGSSWGTGTITVASGAGLDVEVSEANPQSLDKVRGSGAVSVSGAGVVSMTYSTFNATSLTLSVAAESTLKIYVAYSDVQNDLTVANVTLAEGQNAIFVLPDGREVTGTGASVSALQYYTWTPSESDTNWNTLANWTLNGSAASALPGASDDVRVVLSTATTVTLPEAAAVKTLFISGGNLTLSGGTLTTTAVVSSRSETLTVASGAGLVVDGSNNTEAVPTQVSSKVTVDSGATLTTKGYVTLSAENVFNGSLTVESGIASVYAAGTSLAGTITIESGATMKNLRSGDALKYGGKATVDVKGTLDMGSTRWTMGSNNKVNLYAGGVITGAGQGDNGALDWHQPGTLEVLANGDATTATISATLRTRDSGNPTFKVASGLTLDITGLIKGGLKITIDSGEVKLSAANTYSGGTVINKNGIVTIGNATALSTSGTISGAGIINVPGVLPTLASSRFASDWTGRVKISGAKDAIPISNYGPTVEFAGASGYLGPANGTTYTQNIILSGDGWTSKNGNEGKTFIFQGTLSGDGLLKITNTPANGHFYKFEGDVSGFTGPVTVDGKHVIFFANGASDSITFTQNKGKIVINKPVTVGGTWTSSSGIVVSTDAEFTGGTNGGTLRGAVTTANNAAFKVVGGAITLPGTLGTVANNAATFGSDISVADGATLKLTSTTPHTFSGAISGTGTLELTPAVTLTAASATIDAKLTGTGALTIGDGTNTSAVTLTNANTYTGGTTIKNGANLTLNGTTDDTKPLPDCSYDKTTKTYSSKTTVETGAKVQLLSGMSYAYIEGQGTVEVTGNFIFGQGDNQSGIAVPVTVAAGKTFAIRNFRDGEAFNLSSLTLNASSTVKQDTFSDKWTKSASLSITKTLAGTGTINLPLTFESGATLDASGATADGCLTLGSVTMPPEGTVSLTLPATGSDGLAVVKCTSPSTVLAGLSATPPAGYLLGTTDAAVVLKQPTLPSGSGSDRGELSSGAAAALREVAAAAELTSVTAVTGSTTVNGTPTTLTAEAIDNALAVFGKSVVTVDGTELKVDYNFGIVAIEPSDYYFIVKAKAERVVGDSTTAMELASGATLKLVDSETGDVINDLFGGFTYDAGTGLYTAYFTTDATLSDRLIGRTFKVKATKE